MWNLTLTLQPRKSYLHCLNADGHQTWQGGLPWGATADKVTWPFNHVVAPGHLTNWICYISVVTYCEGFPPIKSRISLSTWLCEITWQIKNIPTTICRSSNLSGCWGVSGGAIRSSHPESCMAPVLYLMLYLSISKFKLNGVKREKYVKWLKKVVFDSSEFLLNNYLWYQGYYLLNHYLW